MGRLIETVKKIMVEEGMSFTVPESYPQIVTSYIRFLGNRYYLIFREYEDIEVLQMQIVSPMPAVPPESRLAVSLFLTRLNMRFKLGFLGLDMEDGEVIFRMGVDLEGMQLLEKNVMNMVRCGVQTIDNYFPGIMSICYGGKTDLEALKELDENRVGVELQLAVNPTDAAPQEHEGNR